MAERKELNETSLDEVLGGLSYNPNTKTIQATAGGKVYHYTDFKAVQKMYFEVDEENMTSAQLDAILIPKLLEAGIIYE
jgi:hypothetical protein